MVPGKVKDHTEHVLNIFEEAAKLEAAAEKEEAEAPGEEKKGKVEWLLPGTLEDR